MPNHYPDYNPSDLVSIKLMHQVMRRMYPGIIIENLDGDELENNCMYKVYVLDLDRLEVWPASNLELIR